MDDGERAKSEDNGCPEQEHVVLCVRLSSTIASPSLSPDYFLSVCQIIHARWTARGDRV